MSNVKCQMSKIFVAMSGGVDSSVAAALLKEQKFRVIGGFMKLADLPNFRESEKRAKRIAKILGIPFFVLDLRKEFKKEVIDYFLREYKAGRTPNPCVVCNKKIKFGLFLKEARKRGADFIATGHYARKNPSGFLREFSIFNFQFSNYRLFQAKDKNKDQSYFLWQLNQRQLKHILFPIGGYTKAEVKNLAKKFGILKFVRPASQEICFIYPHTKRGQIARSDSIGKASLRSGVGVGTTINDFLKRHLEQRSGEIIDTKGEIIGKHQGLIFYTIGQRKTIGLSGGPYYVLDKDKKKNILIVTKNEKDLYKKELIAKNVNWISGRAPKLPLRVKVKIRYRHIPSFAIIKKYEIRNTKYEIRFNKPQRAITPGQSVVFYHRQELLGGGIII